ncbi:MAG: ATP-binding cassette domain-containing protein, partial [Planctomycetaceae bacterium]
MIAIRDLQFAWTDGPFRLSIPTLEIARGEAAVLAGPSGCGKTTLLNLISEFCHRPPDWWKSTEQISLACPMQSDD